MIAQNGTVRKSVRSPALQSPKQQITMIFIVIGVFFVMILFIGFLAGFHPPQPDIDLLTQHTHIRIHDKTKNIKRNDDNTIFIAMPTTQDPDCNASIISAFVAAANPDRVFFGIYQQTDVAQYGDCLDISGLPCPNHPLCTRLWQIRVIRVTPNEAQGPTMGRYYADTLFRNETFYLITDSHTFFRPNWDNIAIQMWRATNNEMAIITHYPRGEDQMQHTLATHAESGKSGSYHICGVIWEVAPNHMPRNANGCYGFVKDQSKPVLTPFWGAGYAFSKSHWRNVVPLDPYTPWLFFGEEFHFGARAWTFGYDFYSPQYDVVFHRYADKAHRGHIPWTADKQKMRDKSEKRINYLWDLLEIRTPKETNSADLTEIEKYPLGTKRLLTDYWRFCGVDPIAKNATVYAVQHIEHNKFQRIPWREHDPFLNLNTK